MRRTALAVPGVLSPPQAARKSAWLRSALAQHHDPDPGADNEIVVLATGIDQYLQEVFHHLAYPNRDDTVSAEDFCALCAVLGLSKTHEQERSGGEEEEEFTDVCSGLPCQLSFKDFHARLCGYFRVRSARRGGAGESAWRLPVTEDTELVERQIRLRWPRVRRRKCVSFDLEKDKTGTGTRTGRGRTAEAVEPGGASPDEAAALRELVEDLRSALQGSDARCLALEVALRRQKAGAPPPPSRRSSASSAGKTSITLVEGKLVPTQRLAGADGGARRAARRRDIRDPLLRELRLIRSGRDGQLEEAIRFSRRLEEELQWACREVRRLQALESALRRENAQIRRRAEEAREALSLGLQQVRTIQEQAQSVPQLQARIGQLEAQLQQDGLEAPRGRWRSGCSCSSPPSNPPMNADDTGSRSDAECLQRAVEGRAASDEEEEDRGEGEEGQSCLKEVTRHSSPLHHCDKGCQNQVVHHPQTQGDSRGRCGRRAGGERGRDQEERAEEEEGRTKLQERTGLSLLEDRLTDSLSLLLQLHSRNVSRRVVEKMLMETLDSCGSGSDGPSQVRRAADALSARHAPEEPPGDGAHGGEGGETLLLPPSGGGGSSLLISC
ncbi:EF-hand and coiled-coil domain-containing protein 1 isoform X2 [Salarias fasciatus]|uniref:EF-hand and coiled-coil domain-containing protein 1 isoform X2 n=1 Tax=Salarias fasciatus TaxID=181472 RepID=UPI00117657BB|nr:EF-hand and coiled-coil domain-containing protein 1-like isoform X2 [Salarias fasciatus]